MKIIIAPPGFEPGSKPPKGFILDHYTTGLSCLDSVFLLKTFLNKMVGEKQKSSYL